MARCLLVPASPAAPSWPAWRACSLCPRTSALPLLLLLQGSVGATIRVYIEKYEPSADKHDMPTGEALKQLVAVALELADIQGLTGREAPTVIT